MTRFCTACGTSVVDETARFCAKCGAVIAAPNIWVNERGRELIGDVIRLGKSRTTIIVVAAAALVIVAIAIPNLLHPRAASSSSEESPDASLTPQQIMCMDKLLTDNDWDNKTPAYYAGLNTCGWKAGQPIQPPLGSQ
jgi:zinc-ribbon domain